MKYTDEQLSAAMDSWTEEDAVAAAREGWVMSTTSDNEIQCQRIDDPEEYHFSNFDSFIPPKLAEDVDAWLILMTGTQPHHIKARSILESLDQEEWAKMVKLFNSVKARN